MCGIKTKKGNIWESATFFLKNVKNPTMFSGFGAKSVEWSFNIWISGVDMYVYSRSNCMKLVPSWADFVLKIPSLISETNIFIPHSMPAHRSLSVSTSPGFLDSAAALQNETMTPAIVSHRVCACFPCVLRSCYRSSSLCVVCPANCLGPRPRCH